MTSKLHLSPLISCNAIIITAGYLDSNSGKTAHGLIRGTDRYNIVGVIDQKSAGKDAGEVLDGKNRNIPVYATVEEFAKTSKQTAKYCVIGVATKGGVIPDSLRANLKDGLVHGYGLVNGLHEYISDIPELADFARSRGLEIIDVRKPKKFKDLHFWSGKIKNVHCPKIAVLGTDCALGKRTTTRFLTEAMKKAGYRAEMIYTGQTGWMQGAKYGFVLVQRGHAQLREYWNRVKLQEDVKLGFEILAETPRSGIAHWHVTYQVASEELFRIWAHSTGTNLVARKPGDPLPRMVLDGVLKAEFGSGVCTRCAIWWHSMSEPV